MSERLLSDADVFAIASAVVELMRGDDPPGLLDANEVARRLGCTRSFVYDHAAELGAIAIGSGDRPRKRFSEAAVDAFAEKWSGGRQHVGPPTTAPAHARPRRRRSTTASGAPLLKVRGGAT